MGLCTFEGETCPEYSSAFQALTSRSLNPDFHPPRQKPQRRFANRPGNPGGATKDETSTPPDDGFRGNEAGSCHSCRLSVRRSRLGPLRGPRGARAAPACPASPGSLPPAPGRIPVSQGTLGKSQAIEHIARVRHGLKETPAGASRAFFETSGHGWYWPATVGASCERLARVQKGGGGVRSGSIAHQATRSDG